MTREDSYFLQQGPFRIGTQRKSPGPCNARCLACGVCGFQEPAEHVPQARKDF